MGQGMKSMKSGMKSNENGGSGRLDRASSSSLSSLAPRPLGLVGRRRGAIPAAATAPATIKADADIGGIEIIIPSKTNPPSQQQQQQPLYDQERPSLASRESFACCGPEPFSNYPLSDNPRPPATSSPISLGTNPATDSNTMIGESSSSSLSHDQQALPLLLSELALVCEQATARPPFLTYRLP